MATELLAPLLELKKGSMVLELGAGDLLSANMIVDEYDCQVFPIDIAFDEDDPSFQKVHLNAQPKVVPLNTDVRMLPFMPQQFDCIYAINSYLYFGSDDKFLPYLSKFLKPGGTLAIFDICTKQEINALKDVPAFMSNDFHYFFQHVHELEYWKQKWLKTGLVDITHCKRMGQKELKENYLNNTANDPDAFTKALQSDQENFLDFFILVAKRNQLPTFLETY